METDVERGSFGNALRRLRRAAGLSQEELAERAALSVEGISALERGRRRAPYRTTIRMIADALGATEVQRRELEAAAQRRVDPSGVIAYDSWDNSAKSRPPDRRLHNLVRALSSFCGRESELTALESLLAEHPLVSIVGTGGIGKTRVALALGWKMLGRFRDGVWFIDLAPLSDDAVVARSVMTILGIPSGGAQPDSAALRHHLEHREALLIVDNCEHVADQVAALAEALLPACLDLRFLVTSRERLRISGEHVYLMPALPSPPVFPALTAAQSLEFPAVRLFVDRARALNAEFALTDATAQTIGEICRRVDGIALAIELAASRTAAFRPDLVLAQLDAHFGMPLSASRTALPRHRTMRETIRWSCDRLSDSERIVLRSVSIFVNGFTLESARAVVGTLSTESLEGIVASLVDRSLVAADLRGSAPRYRLLQPVRAYALEKLAEAAESAIVRDRFLEWCLALVEKAHDAWERCGSSVWSAAFEPEMDNLRSALLWSLEEGNAVLYGQRLIAHARRLYGRLPTEGKRWLATAQANVTPETPQDVLAGLALAEASCDVLLRLYNTGLTAARRYETIVGDDAVDKKALAEAQELKGFALLSLGRIDEGVRIVEESLRVFREGCCQQLAAQALISLGIARGGDGDLSGSRDYFGEALRIFQTIGNTRGAGSAAMNLAETEFCAGDTKAAIALCERALEEFGSGREAQLCLANLAAYLVAAGRYDEAKEKARASVFAGGIARLDVDGIFALQHLTAVAALRPILRSDARDDDSIRAAQLIGFVDARLAQHAAMREHTEKSEYETVVASLTAQFGIPAFEAFKADGRTWTEDEAIYEALLI